MTKRTLFVTVNMSLVFLFIACNAQTVTEFNPAQNSYTYTLVPQYFIETDKERGTRTHDGKSIDAEVKFGPNCFWQLLIKDRTTKSLIFNFTNFENNGTFIRLQDKETTPVHRVYMLEYRDQGGVSNRITVDAGPSARKGKYSLHFFVYRNQKDTMHVITPSTVYSMEFSGYRDNLDSITYQNIMYPPDIELGNQ